MNESNLLVHMNSGYVTMAQSQFFRGYCLLIATPTVTALNDLSFQARQHFLSDMSLIGDAITSVCQPRRINYAILGNKDPYLHAHIIPRYTWEDPALQVGSVWSYPDEFLNGDHSPYSETEHGRLKQQLIHELQRLMQSIA